ncbi:hypothetical protein ABKA04_005474 [Annulohypoxylon sp. FPYF3050]
MISDPTYSLTRYQVNRVIKVRHFGRGTGAFRAFIPEAHSVIGGDYLAGNWSADLVNGLRWQSWNGLLQRAAQYRAPSWSWAAYDGQVCHLSPESDDEQQDRWTPTIISAWTKPRDSTDISPYGACAAGKIIMETSVVRFSITGDTLDYYQAYAGQETTFKSDMVQLQDNKENSVCTVFPDTTAGIPKDRILCGAFITPSWGLVLAKSKGSDIARHTNEQDDEFIRVGWFGFHEKAFSRYQQKKITLI